MLIPEWMYWEFKKKEINHIDFVKSLFDVARICKYQQISVYNFLAF